MRCCMAHSRKFSSAPVARCPPNRSPGQTLRSGEHSCEATDLQFTVGLPHQHARVAKSADAKDLKSFSPQGECGFKSRPGHHLTGWQGEPHTRRPLAAPPPLM